MTSCIDGVVMRWVLLVGMGAGVSACHVVHLRKDAPGDVEVMQPPKEIAAKGTHVPDDPGEEIVSMTVGYSGAFGGMSRGLGHRRVDFAYQPSLEVSFAWYDLEESLKYQPEADSFVPGDVFGRFPERSYTQLNVGWAPVEIISGGEADAHLGPLYLELQRTVLFDDHASFSTSSLAGGYVYNPWLGSHGPQVTLSFLGNGFFVRSAYLIGQGVFVGGGFTMKIPAVMGVGSQ